MAAAVVGRLRREAGGGLGGGGTSLRVQSSFASSFLLLHLNQ